MGFRQRSIATAETLGEKLRLARETDGWTLDVVATRLKIPVKYLLALEENAYHRLPGRVYAEGFLKKYAQFLRLSQARVLSIFRTESQIALARSPSQWAKTPLENETPKTRVWMTPGILRVAGVGIVVLTLLSYLVVQVGDIISAPDLVVTEPSDSMKTTELSVTIVGETEPETSVTINGQAVTTTREGVFEERVDLRDGLNIVKIGASRKHSKENIVYKKILVERSAEVSLHSAK